MSIILEIISGWEKNARLIHQLAGLETLRYRISAKVPERRVLDVPGEYVRPEKVPAAFSLK
jgi:hypothetical protein